MRITGADSSLNPQGLEQIARTTGVKMKNLLLSVAILSFLWTGVGVAGPTGPAEGAPPELAHFVKLVGEWSTTEEGLKPDGSAWQPSKGADWNFYWSFDGWGIRDDYISPPMSEAVDDESKRQRGTNLRIFNTSDKHWVMTWLTPTLKEPASFTAASTDEEIVMLSGVVNPQGFWHRITFFDMTESSFEWKLEWSKDKDQWGEVYRIHGTRKTE